MTIRASAVTDIGSIRAENEDSFLCNEKLGVFAVADGIGGLPGGAEASHAAVRFLEQWFVQHGAKAEPDYYEALRLANERVFLLGREMSPRYGIGTTLTLAHFAPDGVQVIHVGDSFLLRARGGQIEALTTEHNVENEIRIRGNTRLSPTENRAALTRCVGQPPPLQGDLFRVDVQAGDRYLVCTDGITRCITPKEIAAHLRDAESPKHAATSLVQLARERGGVDNATAVVVFVD